MAGGRATGHCVLKAFETGQGRPGRNGHVPSFLDEDQTWAPSIGTGG